MTARSRGRGLFIVDNSVSGWTGLRYLKEWTGIAKAFDIATGYFEIGALLSLDGKWQGLDRIRILMGAETTHRTRKALLEAVRRRATDRLDRSLEEDKKPNPFLHGVPAVLEALRSRQIECRVYDRDKFHAKAYITHARLEVVGAQALVGSSNFTRPGLTENVELNVQIQSAREVAQLQEWFETHWERAREVNDAVVETISRHTRRYSPFDVYAKALQEFFRGHELTATECDETRSRMFHQLDRYQQEAYWALMKIGAPSSGRQADPSLRLEVPRRRPGVRPRLEAAGQPPTCRFSSRPRTGPPLRSRARRRRGPKGRMATTPAGAPRPSPVPR